MKQLEIDFEKRMSRRFDPETSKIAARNAVKRGSAKYQREMCLMAVKRCPGLTAAEYAAGMGIERHIPSRRLPELRPEFVRNGEKRLCTEQDALSMTWYPVEEV